MTDTAPTDPTPTDDVADRRARRRAARRDENRADILDAAEQVFGAHGPGNGSLRQIAEASGFSTAAIYLFFANKEDLLAETLQRRGVELAARLALLAEGPGTPREQLHHVVDATVDFFTAHPDFRLLLSHLRGGPAITGPVLAAYAGADATPFHDVMRTLAGLIEAGQRSGDVRAGDARALAHLFSVLVNEHLFLTSSPTGGSPRLTAAQFHDLIDALLQPARPPEEHP